MNIDLPLVTKHLEWLKTKLHLASNAASAKRRLIKRGQVYRCDFGVGIGSEMQKDRPAVILQNDIANYHSGNTIVAPITHDAASLPCMVPITTLYESDGTTVRLDGSVNTANIVCISKARLGVYIDSLSSGDMKKVDEATAKSLDLMTHYAKLQCSLQDKLTYIEKVKQQRNEAQDQLKELYAIMEVDSQEKAVEYLKQNT